MDSSCTDSTSIGLARELLGSAPDIDCEGNGKPLSCGGGMEVGGRCGNNPLIVNGLDDNGVGERPCIDPPNSWHTADCGGSVHCEGAFSSRGCPLALHASSHICILENKSSLSLNTIAVINKKDPLHCMLTLHITL